MIVALANQPRPPTPGNAFGDCEGVWPAPPALTAPNQPAPPKSAVASAAQVR